MAGLSYMWPSMAGQTTTGARVASTVVVRASSASPWAMRAMVLAVAGATTTRSARSAMATWSMPKLRARIEYVGYDRAMGDAAEGERRREAWSPPRS